MKTQRVTSYNPQRNGKALDFNMCVTVNVVVPMKRAERTDYSATNGHLHDLITVRCSNTQAVTRASVWITSGERYGAGHGKAGGYGYHRRSQAIENALRSAGVTFAQPFGGCGDSAVEDALRALARFLGYRRCLIVTN